MVDAFERDVSDVFDRRMKTYVALRTTQGIAYGIAAYYDNRYHRLAKTRTRSMMITPFIHPKDISRNFKKIRRAERGMKVAASAGRISGKLATRGIPIIGGVLFAYDVYTVADWMFAKGKLPAGAKRRD